MARPSANSLNPDITKVTGKTVARVSDGQHTRAGQSRPPTVNLGGAYTPDTRRLSYGSAGVGGSSGSSKKASQRHKSEVHNSSGQ